MVATATFINTYKFNDAPGHLNRMTHKTDAPFECILNSHACYKTVNAVVAASFFFGILSISTSFRTAIYQTDEAPMSKCISNR